MKLKVLFPIMCCLVLFITSCKNPISDNNKTKVETTLIKTTQPLKFNLSNATAIAAVSSMDAQSRATTAQITSPLAKVLNDSTIVDALSLPKKTKLAKINKMITVKSNGKKYLYVIFQGQSYYSYEEVKTYEKKIIIEHEPDKDGNVLPPEEKIEIVEKKDYCEGTVSELICIAEDGSYDDVLEYGNCNYYCLGGDDLVTDKNGVIYFTTYNNKGARCVRRYYPTEKKLEAISAELNDTIFEKLQISEDNKMLFISGVKNSPDMRFDSFIRYIPVESPANFINIYYTTNHGGNREWIYQDSTDSFYYIGWKYNQNSYPTPELFRINNLKKIKTKDDLLKNTVQLSRYRQFDNCEVDLYSIETLYDYNTGILLKSRDTHDPLLRVYYKDDKCIFEPFSGFNPISAVKYGNNFIFNSCIIDSNGQDSGFRKLLLLDTSNFTFTDLFQNTPDNLNIISYSVSNDKVYFSAEAGISVILGCIDIPTLEYTPLNTNQVINLIEAY